MYFNFLGINIYYNICAYNMNNIIGILFLLLLIIIIWLFDILNCIIDGFEINNIEINNIEMYVISLKHKNRLDNIKEQQSKINTNIEIFDAVKGDKLNINQLMDDNKIPRGWEKNEAQHKLREIGCYLSHYNIYTKILNDKLPGYTIIFEDDFNIQTDNFENDVISLIKNSNDDFDMIYLGNWYNNHGTIINNNLYNLDKDNHLIGTHAYIVNNKNIEKIIKATTYIDMPIDHKIYNLGKNDELLVLVVYPTIVNMIDSPSTIKDMTIETFNKIHW